MGTVTRKLRSLLRAVLSVFRSYFVLALRNFTFVLISFSKKRGLEHLRIVLIGLSSRSGPQLASTQPPSHGWFAFRLPATAPLTCGTRGHFCPSAIWGSTGSSFLMKEACRKDGMGSLCCSLIFAAFGFLLTSNGQACPQDPQITDKSIVSEMPFCVSLRLMDLWQVYSQQVQSNRVFGTLDKPCPTFLVFRQDFSV